MTVSPACVPSPPPTHEAVTISPLPLRMLARLQLRVKQKESSTMAARHTRRIRAFKTHQNTHTGAYDSPALQKEHAAD